MPSTEQISPQNLAAEFLQKSHVASVDVSYVGDRLKVGIGRNFRDFSDDLTDLSYDQSGFVLNITGSPRAGLPLPRSPG